jgi:hypothetical protein
MRKLSLLTILGVMLAMSTGVAAAATATLTHTEYQELSALQDAIVGTKSAKSVAAIESLGTNCRQLSPVSALMRGERADCTAVFQWLTASLKTLQKLKPCSEQHTVSGRFSCLLPSYVSIEGATRALYRAERRVTEAAVARGFSHTCVLALGEGSRAIADEAHMSSDIANMVSAMRRGDVLSTQKWGSLYDAATAEMEAAGKMVLMSTCPHE